MSEPPLESKLTFKSRLTAHMFLLPSEVHLLIFKNNLIQSHNYPIPHKFFISIIQSYLLFFVTIPQT